MESADRASPRPAKQATKKGAAKKDSKKSSEEVDAVAVEAEAERQRKKAEAEAAAMEAADAKKDKIRPKQYSAEEKKAWREYAQSMSDFFGELV